MRYQNFTTYDPLIAIDFIRNEEGYRLHAYKCPAGVWTIGYGHTKGVKEGDSITHADAEDFLASDIIERAREMSAYIHVKVTKWQFIALVSLVFNVGDLRRKAPKLLHYLNSSQEDKAAHEFLDICSAGGKVIPGLKARREKEAKLFLRTDE